MPTVTVREQRRTETGFDAVVIFDNGPEYDITVSDPFAPEDEARLELLFEKDQPGIPN